MDTVVILPTPSEIEVVLRYIVASIATVVAVLVWRGLDKRLLKPRALFVYLGMIVTLQAVWRWFIVSLVYAEDDFYPAGLLTLIQPVNAALLTLLLISVGMLVLWRIREGSPHDD